MPSWHPLTQTGLRSAILAPLGRSSRLLGHGQPRPGSWFTSLIASARINRETFQKPKRLFTISKIPVTS
jgi:hypothetical protein